MTFSRTGKRRFTPLIFSALIALPACSPAASRPVPAPGDSLIGAWRSNIQFSSGPFASIKDLQFLYVFNAGGTLTESSNYDGAPPVPPAYGVWRQVAPNKLEARYVFFNTKPPARFDDIKGGGGWTPAGHGVFTEHIEVSVGGRSFESTMTYEAFDVAGKPADGGGQAKAHGVRVDF